ncbi:MAG: hypothetical protein AAF449_11075 [Myxococcota bacterium]
MSDIDAVPLGPICLEFLLEEEGELRFHAHLQVALPRAIALVRQHGTAAAVEYAREETYALVAVLRGQMGAMEAAQQLRAALSAAGLMPPAKAAPPTSSAFRRFAGAIEARRAPQQDAAAPEDTVKLRGFLQPGAIEARRAGINAKRST